MTAGLIRYHTQGDLHFITCSCYRRFQLLGSPVARDIFLEILEGVRRKYIFRIIGYVVMPEHFHLLMNEPASGRLSTVMQVLKQRVAKRCREGRVLRNPSFWTSRYYDFNVFSQQKKVEKLDYIHHNPVKRGLVESSDMWQWSSAQYYRSGEQGVVQIGDFS